jgi:hypothetical protein
MARVMTSLESYFIRKILITVLLTIFVTIPTCSEQSAHECPNGLEPFKQVTLYFGLSSPEGVISNLEWQRYLEEVVTPNFPEGFTVFDSYGQWKNPEGVIIDEPGKVITHLFDIHDPKNNNIESVIGEFKERHQAQSVIREENVVCVSF